MIWTSHLLILSLCPIGRLSPSSHLCGMEWKSWSKQSVILCLYLLRSILSYISKFKVPHKYKQTLEVFLPWSHWGSLWWRGCEPPGRATACACPRVAPATATFDCDNNNNNKAKKRQLVPIKWENLQTFAYWTRLKFYLRRVVVRSILLGPTNPQAHHPSLNLQRIRNRYNFFNVLASL